MGYERALARIAQAAREGRTALDLSDYGLSTLPPEIGQLTSLTELRLRNNQVSELPAEIGQLTSLRELRLSNNRASELPPEIGQLTSLRRLNLDDNQLNGLPSEIGQLSSLTTLDLRDNELSELPPEIGQLTSLTGLDLGRNQLSELPSEIGQLTSLRRLDVGFNQLTALPFEIGQLISLMNIFLTDNELTALPSEIGQLTSLTVLDLRRNPLGIPPEILKKMHDAQAILSYYFENVAVAPEETRALNEVKLLLLGEGGVGKTSLVKRLLHNIFNEGEAMTDGINIEAWRRTIEGEDVQLNVWDFGGQEIMHSTHQFFLTERSVYLVVIDAREEDLGGRLEHWLKIAGSFGKDSPVIVVTNKFDVQPFELDRRGLRAKYPTIQAFVNTSCKTGEGIAELAEKIEAAVGTLKHVHNPLNLTWFEVKEALETMEADYISIEDYHALCEGSGVHGGTSQRTLVGFLHDLGVVLNYRDKWLEDTQILNPEWVTNAVYRVVTDKVTRKGRGVLHLQRLDDILDAGRYPGHKHRVIVNVMRKFELLYPIDGGDVFMIPDMLPKEEPEGAWREEETLGFQYEYDVLPDSIMTRFITRMNPFIHEGHVWRTGAVVADDRNRARVKADRDRRRIDIEVAGQAETRRDFLSLVRGQLRVIHAGIPGLNVDERVPLPQAPDATVGYKFLLELYQEGVTEHRFEGYKGKVDVWELVEGVASPAQMQADSIRYKIVYGDEIEMGDISGIEAVAIGRGASASVLVAQASESLWHRLGEEERALVDQARQAVEAEAVTREELKAALEPIEDVLGMLQQGQLTLENRGLQREAVQLAQVVGSELSVAHKLKLTLPIVPLLLSYNLEAQLGTKLDLAEGLYGVWEWVRGAFSAKAGG